MCVLKFNWVLRIPAYSWDFMQANMCYVPPHPHRYRNRLPAVALASMHKQGVHTPLVPVFLETSWVHIIKIFALSPEKEPEVSPRSTGWQATSAYHRKLGPHNSCRHVQLLCQNVTGLMLWAPYLLQPTVLGPKSGCLQTTLGIWRLPFPGSVATATPMISTSHEHAWNLALSTGPLVPDGNRSWRWKYEGLFPFLPWGPGTHGKTIRCRMSKSITSCSDSFPRKTRASGWRKDNEQHMERSSEPQWRSSNRNLVLSTPQNTWPMPSNLSQLTFFEFSEAI